MSFATIVIILGIVQGFFLGIILLSIKRGNRKANRVIGVLLILFAYSITPMVFIKTGVYFNYPHLLKTAQPLLFLFGPLFLLYTKILTDRKYYFNWIQLWHLIPFIVFVLYLIPVFIMSGNEKVEYLKDVIGGAFKFERIVTPLQIIHLFVYMYVVNRLVNNHILNLKKSFSSIEKINLNWLKNGVWGFVTIFAIMAVLIIIQISYYPIISNHEGETIAILVSLVIYYIGYKGLQQPEIFIGGQDGEPVTKYEKSTLDLQKVKEYKEKLVEYMKNEKPYLDGLLTIKDLAVKIKIPSYHLSQMINENFKQNFFDFINSYRIEEAKKSMLDHKNDHISIQGIAFEVGFNSKSAFNNAFKKYTNKTPSEYRFRK